MVTTKWKKSNTAETKGKLHPQTPDGGKPQLFSCGLGFLVAKVKRKNRKQTYSDLASNNLFHYFLFEMEIIMALPC